MLQWVPCHSTTGMAVCYHRRRKLWGSVSHLTTLEVWRSHQRLTPFEDVKQQHGVHRVRSGPGGTHAISSVLSEVETIERRKLRNRGGQGGKLWAISTIFAITHGTRVVVTTAAGLWDDEGSKVLWWQCPRKLGGGVCVCEERVRTILHGKKGVG
jgi:hypothetical protein